MRRIDKAFLISTPAQKSKQADDFHESRKRQGRQNFRLILNPVWTESQDLEAFPEFCSR
jgi:hypothetical protein